MSNVPHLPRAAMRPEAGELEHSASKRLPSMLSVFHL